MADAPLPELMRRLAEGDQDAASELVRRYEPEIRRAVRVRLTDPRLRRVIDSVDVCQSVFANFFLRAAVGEYDLNQSGELAALLAAMARNKLLDQVRRMQSLKRDQRRMELPTPSAMEALAESSPGPDELAAERDLLAEVRKRLSSDERQLADLRTAGYEWGEIAEKLGALPDGLRKKLTRALDRVTKEMKIDDLA